MLNTSQFIEKSQNNIFIIFIQPTPYYINDE